MTLQDAEVKNDEKFILDQLQMAPNFMSESQQNQVPNNSNEDNFEELGMAELLAQHESETLETAKTVGSFILAKVVSIVESGALVDIGEKAEALIPRIEFGPNPPFAIGDSVPVLVSQGIRREDHLKVSWRAARDKMAWEQIVSAQEKKIPIHGKVKSETKGGLLFECDFGLVGFIPASQIDVRPSRDLKKWTGKEMSVYIMEYDVRKNNLVLSRKQWQSEVNLKLKTQTLTELKIGDVKTGVVTGITTFGAFVDIGGIEGLLHIGELEWGHTKKVGDVLRIGQEIKVKVIKFDAAKDKVSLSRRELLPHPWDGVEERFPAGSVVPGMVVSITDFGAFVEIAPQVEGLLHASEVSWKTNSINLKESLKVGQKLQVKVLGVNRQKEKISLSAKRVEANPWDTIEHIYPIGSRTKVLVTTLAPFGAFVKLKEGIEGLIHISDFSWTKRVKNPQDMIAAGQEIEAQVLEINKEKEKISFGLKQLKANPYETYSRGSKITGKVIQLMEAGAVVEIDSELEAFVPSTEITSEKFVKPQDLLQVGDMIEAKVIQVDAKERKLNVSIKQLDRDLQIAATKKYSDRAPRPNLGKLLDS